MKENASMNHSQNEIIAILRKSEDQDLLVFQLEKEHRIRLKSSDCQQDIKELFSEILRKLLRSSLVIKLEVEEGYSNALMIDVCTEYVKDLNKEINQIVKSLPEELKIV